MTQLDRRGSSDPVSAPFTPSMRDNPEELALIPDEIARERVLPEEPTPTEALRIVRSLAHEWGVADDRHGSTVWASLGGPSRRRSR